MVFSVFSSVNYLETSIIITSQQKDFWSSANKTALAIEEGIFNDAFGETIIRVNKIDKDKKTIHDVLIYDHSEKWIRVLYAVMSSLGVEMYTTEDGHFFVMKLDTGSKYKEGEKIQN
ncbi:MAG: LptF/LptG family permease [Saprospiraceae bacterium]|nr:LptF/LptG family permease [Saprospiraceae bacterium]